MEKWAGMTFDLLVFVGKIKKPTARVFFLWGKQKALITKSRWTTRCTKSLQKP